jgi:hypothetical protein
MGVSGSIILADWAELQRQWREAPGAIQEPGFFEEGWPDSFLAQSWRPEGWISSWNAASQAALAYDRLRKGLDPETRAGLDRILGAFFWEGGTTSPDLPGFEPSEGISNVLGPSTVDSMVDFADSMDLETLREQFSKRCRKKDLGGWIGSFDDFRDYVSQWLAMLRAAKESGRAVVLWVA